MFALLFLHIKKLYICIYVYFRSKNINFPGERLGLKIPQGLIWGYTINVVY